MILPIMKVRPHVRSGKVGFVGDIETLRTVCTPITSFDEALRTLAADMAETARNNNGIGIAAPQVGITQQLFVMADDPTAGTSTPNFLTVINPVIEEYDPATYIDQEGCLSIPNILAQVTRSIAIR